MSKSNPNQILQRKIAFLKDIEHLMTKLTLLPGTLDIYNTIKQIELMCSAECAYLDAKYELCDNNDIFIPVTDKDTTRVESLSDKRVVYYIGVKGMPAEEVGGYMESIIDKVKKERIKS